MKNQTQKFIFGIAVVVLLIGAVQYFFRGQVNLTLPNLQIRNTSNVDKTLPSVTEAAKEESVTVDFGNGRKLSGQVSTQSAYQALVAVAEDNNMEVEVKQYTYGIMVTAVGEVVSSAKESWMYSVNGKPGQIAADRYIIYPGDKVLWEFKKF